MADRYWIGNSGNWSDTAHWSASSGGAGGETVPTSSDDVYFDANSFSSVSQAVSFNVDSYCKGFNTTAVTNSPSFTTTSTSRSLFVYGDFLLGTHTWDTGRVLIYLNSTTTCSIDTNGVVLKGCHLLPNASGSFTLLSNIDTRGGSLSGNDYNGYFGAYDTGATLDIQGYTINTGYFLNYGTTDMTGSAINVYGTASYPAYIEDDSVTTTATNSVINIYATDGSEFYAYSDATYGEVIIHITSGTFTFRALNSSTYRFATNKLNLSNAAGATIRFLGSRTYYVGDLTAVGSAGSLITIKSVTDTVTHTLSSAGTITCDYLNIRDSIASGGATFTANNSTDSGNNTGWTFVTNASIEPATLDMAYSTLSPTLTGDAGVSANTLVGNYTINTSSVTGSATITPDSVSYLATILAPTVGTVTRATSDTLVVNAGMLEPSITGAAAITPDTLMSNMSLLEPDVRAIVRATGDVIVNNFTILAPTITGEANIEPDTISIIGEIPEPTVRVLYIGKTTRWTDKEGSTINFNDLQE